MVRIFIGLALFALSLLLGNVVVAFAIGDFGAASREYASARRALRSLRTAPDATAEQMEAQSSRLERIAGELRRQRNRFWPHIWLGIAASLISLLVHSISITYFIGTSRWCREVSEAYSMENGLAEQSDRLKRKAFAWSLTGILLTLGIAGLGAAADPFSSSANPSSWVVWHWTAGLGGFVVIAASFYYQARLIRANHDVIEQMLADAQQIRASRAVV